MKEVFISYSSADMQTAEAVVSALEQAELSCWIAPRDITAGSNYGAAITSALKACKALVLLFSVNSNTSDAVFREVQLAFEEKKTIIPLRIDEVPVSDDLGFFLSGLHWLDAVSARDNFDNLILDIKRALNTAPQVKPSAGAAAHPRKNAPLKKTDISVKNTLIITTGLVICFLFALAAYIYVNTDSSPALFETLEAEANAQGTPPEANTQTPHISVLQESLNPNTQEPPSGPLDEAAEPNTQEPPSGALQESSDPNTQEPPSGTLQESSDPNTQEPPSGALQESSDPNTQEPPSGSVQIPSGGEYWTDNTGNTPKPRDSRDVRNDTKGFSATQFTPIKFMGETTLYAQNYGYESNDKYDIKLFILESNGEYTQIGRLYGKGDNLRAEVFDEHEITLVWQRHTKKDKFYEVTITGPYSVLYEKDFMGKDTGYTNGEIYIRYGAPQPKAPKGNQ